MRRTARPDELDLNLLRVFDALFTERHVGRAAIRLHRSQPAVSNALARLRAALRDPLFVRTRDGVIPSERALQLAPAVAQALRSLRDAMEPARSFDPARTQRTFTLAASDHAQLLVLPPLVKQLDSWPGIRLRVVPLPARFPLGELERGELDLVLGIFDLAAGDRAPVGLKRQLLVEERIVAVARRGNRTFRRARPEDLTLRQLAVSPRGGTEGAFDRRLQLGPRNVVVFVPHYGVAPWLLASTDLIVALPERIAERFCEAFPLETRPLPWLKAGLRVQQLWHPRMDGAPDHRWLRQRIFESARRPSGKSRS